MIFNRFFFNYLSKLVVFALFIFLLHFIVLKVIDFKRQVYEMHVFMLTITVFTHIFLLFLKNKNSKYLGFGFLAAGFIKMIIVVVYLLPEIFNQKNDTYSYIFQFFGLYFVYLSFEVVNLVSLLKNTDE